MTSRPFEASFRPPCMVRSQNGELERIRAELRSTISIATGHHKIEVDHPASSVRKMTEESRDAVSHHTPYSGECDATRLAIQKPKLQDELFLMMYDTSTKRRARSGGRTDSCATRRAGTVAGDGS